jgi:hypothetical protein
MIEDGIGLGKALQAILAMWLCRDEPGMPLVVVPAKSLLAVGQKNRDILRSTLPLVLPHS